MVFSLYWADFSHWVFPTRGFFHAGVWTHPAKLICVFWPPLGVVGCVQFSWCQVMNVCSM